MPKNATIIAGPNGVGKTTFAQRYLDLRTSEYISADRIALSLNPDDVKKARVRAGKLFFQHITAGISKEQDMLIEVTLAGRSFRRIIEWLKQADYKIRITFIFLESSELCVRRVRQRVAGGGHDIPAEDVIRRFQRSITNFWHIYKDMADMWSIYSNSSNRFDEVAAGVKDHIDVYDNSLLELFMNNIRERIENG